MKLNKNQLRRMIISEIQNLGERRSARGAAHKPGFEISVVMEANEGPIKLKIVGTGEWGNVGTQQSDSLSFKSLDDFQTDEAESKIGNALINMIVRSNPALKN